ncbi:MAG: hypothetical protein HUJ51_02505 [Eggerthellaceae bacterium]|nr:hypothetical protein [Eggerthellaceae bacterium]
MFEEVTNPYAKPIVDCIKEYGDRIQFCDSVPNLPELVVLGQTTLTSEKLNGLGFILREAGLNTKPVCFLACNELDLLAVLEGLDPQGIICIDTFACKALIHTYNAKVNKAEFKKGICTVFGRPTLLFSNLEKCYEANRVKCLKKLIQIDSF